MRFVIQFKNYYLLVIWRLILAYILYTLCRLVFLIYNWDLLQPMETADIWSIFRGGLMFDTTAILYTNILYLLLAFIPAPFVFRPWWQRMLRVLYIAVNFICTTMNLGDTVYFPFGMRRISMTFFSEFTGDVHFGKIFIESLAMFWYITLIGIAMLFLLIWLSGKYSGVKASSSSRWSLWRPLLIQLLALLITAPLFIIGVRGGATRTMRPITLSNAGDFVKVAIHTQAVLNTPFSLIRTIGKAKFTKLDFYPDEALLNSLFSPVKKFTTPFCSEPADTASTSGRGEAIRFTPQAFDEIAANGNNMPQKNIVILIVESFAAENMSFLNPDLKENLTPFLDSLSRHALLCTNAFANGRKSIDAVPSILASVPSLITSFAVTPYATDELKALPDILTEEGYYCAFMHGAPNNSMGIRAVSHMCGIDNYFGKTEFGDDSKFDGAWGIWDEYFLPYAARTIGTFKEPFFTGIFTLSSHHPFKLPAQWQGKFPQGETDLQRVTPYTDMSLRLFFNEAKKSPWYKNTIFVITPDHSTLTGHAPKYKTPIWSTSIPIIFYAPGLIEPGRYDAPVQQLDIMPTLLGMLGYNKPYFAFGRDLNRESLPPFVINYGTNQFQMLQGDTLLVRDNKKLVAAYLYKTDTLLEHNLLEAAQPHPAAHDALLRKQDNLFKAIIQQYVNRMIDNRMTPEN